MNPLWLLVAILAVGFTVLAVLLWLGARERRCSDAELRAIRALAPHQAKALALALLRRADLFQTRSASQPFTHPDLPPDVLDFFATFDEASCGEFRVARELFGPAQRLPGFLRVGEDAEFTELLVRPGDNRLYVLPGEDAHSLPEPEPTLWHEVIIASGLPLRSICPPDGPSKQSEQGRA